MKKTFKYITNKYLLATALFLLWILVFDECDFFEQRKHLKQLSSLNEKAANYRKEIDAANKRLTDIKNNDEAKEKFAREKYFMKKPGEDIYIIEPSH